VHKEACEGQGCKHDDGRSVLSGRRQQAVHLGDEDTADDGRHPQAEVDDDIQGRQHPGPVLLADERDDKADAALEAAAKADAGDGRAGEPSRTWRSRATSSASAVSGNCGAVTR
jgi:hypothetical protein